jgi:hypothetical protein
VSVLKYRDIVEHANSFDLFLDEHAGPLFESLFKESAGADGEALAAAREGARNGSSVRGGGGGSDGWVSSTCFENNVSVLSRSQRSGHAAVRARLSRCVLTGYGIITLAEARLSRIRYTTFNVHNFEPIAGAGASTRLAISLSLSLTYVGSAGGGAQLHGVHGKAHCLFPRATQRDESRGRGAFEELEGFESDGDGYFAGADAAGKGSKASAGVFRGDRHPLAVLRGEASTWEHVSADVHRSERSAMTGLAPPATSYTFQRRK